MPFFKSSKKKIISRNNTETTILAKDVTINGHIETSSNLHIDGTFEGDIISSSLVIIGKSGVAKSDIKADKLIVSGSVSGSVIAKNVEIMPEGKIIGNVSSEEFIIEKDGVFEGESHHLKIEEKNEELSDPKNKESKTDIRNKKKKKS